MDIVACPNCGKPRVLGLDRAWCRDVPVQRAPTPAASEPTPRVPVKGPEPQRVTAPASVAPQAVVAASYRVPATQGGFPSIQTAPAYASPSSPAAVVIVVVLVLIGIFWLAVATLQLWAALSVGPRDLALTGVWNIIVGGWALSLVNDVLHRKRRVVNQALWLAGLGAVWGLVAAVWLGGWFQLLVVPLYITLGIMVWSNSGYFVVGADRAATPTRSFRLSTGGWTKAASPVSPMEVPQSPAWEFAAPTSAASYCIKCGAALVSGPTFCHVCGTAAASVS